MPMPTCIKPYNIGLMASYRDEMSDEQIQTLYKAVVKNKIIDTASLFVREFGDKLTQEQKQKLFDDVYVKSWSKDVGRFKEMCPEIQPTLIAEANARINSFFNIKDKKQEPIVLVDRI